MNRIMYPFNPAEHTEFYTIAPPWTHPHWLFITVISSGVVIMETASSLDALTLSVHQVYIHGVPT